MYTVVIQGKPRGPYTLTELRALSLQPGTFVKRPGMDDYKEAHELPELRDLFGFSEIKVMPQYFAAFDQRVVADIVDYLLILSIYILVMFLIYLIFSLNGFRVIAAGFFLLIPISRLIYGAFAESSVKQATLGKRWVNIKVCDAEGSRLTLTQAMGRNFAKILSCIPLGIGYFYCMFNKKQQCFHDLIADTLVIKDRLL